MRFLFSGSLDAASRRTTHLLGLHMDIQCTCTTILSGMSYTVYCSVKTFPFCVCSLLFPAATMQWTIRKAIDRIYIPILIPSDRCSWSSVLALSTIALPPSESSSSTSREPPQHHLVLAPEAAGAGPAAVTARELRRATRSPIPRLPGLPWALGGFVVFAGLSVVPYAVVVNPKSQIKDAIAASWQLHQDKSRQAQLRPTRAAALAAN